MKMDSIYNYPEDLNFTNDFNLTDDDNYEDIYFFICYPFERMIYTYICFILVTLTLIHNAVVISVVVQRKMRTPTFVILAAISTSDSLTGLVTVPPYLLVFSENSPETIFESPGVNISLDLNTTNATGDDNLSVDFTLDALSKELCDGFMFSKFFLSKSFHTMSAWFTLLLGLQRFLIVFSPLKRKPLFQLTIKKTMLTCLAVLVLAPFLHIHHLFKDKSVKYTCTWSLDMGKSCEEDCVYFWFALLLGHLIPAIALTFFTGFFVYSLQKSTKALRNIASSRREKNATFTNRQRENRFASLIVVTVVIVFLIAELPYAVFLLYIAISAHAELIMNLKFNRAVQSSYEIILLLSFNANFYIYAAFNRRFRHALIGICVTFKRYCFSWRCTCISSRDFSAEANSERLKMKTFKVDGLNRNTENCQPLSLKRTSLQLQTE